MEVLIGRSSQLSIDVLGVSVDICWEVSVEERVLLSIDTDLFSLRIVHSKSAMSKNSSDCSLFLMVLLGMHLKEIKKFFFISFLETLENLN